MHHLRAALSAIASMARCDREPLPIEPKLYLPGSRLSNVTSSATELTPSALLTTSALGQVINCVIGAMSFAGSSLENKRVLMASGPPIEMPIVAPSGWPGDGVGAEIAAGAGLVLDHEALAELLQPVGDQPRHHVGVEPGPNGTTIPTVLVGQSCAAAGASAHSDLGAIARLVFIRLSRILRTRHVTIMDDRVIASGEFAACRLARRRPSFARQVTALPGPAMASTAPAGAVPGHAAERAAAAKRASAAGSNGPVAHRTVLFLGAHVRDAARRAPPWIARIGEWPYKGLMGLASLVGLIVIGRRLRPLPRD